MANLSYANYFKTLFENTNSTNDPYSVNPLFYNMQTTSSFDTASQPSSFLKDVESIDVYTQKEADVKYKIENPTINFEPSAQDGFVILNNNRPDMPPVSTKAGDISHMFGCYLDLKYSTTLNANKLSKTLTDYAVYLHNSDFEFLVNDPSPKVYANYNSKFSTYLKYILFYLCGPFYEDSLRKLSTYTQDRGLKMYEACQEISKLYTMRLDRLKLSLDEQLQKSLNEIVSQENPANDNNNFRDLQTINGFRSPFYYKLRTHLVQNFKLRSEVFFSADTEVTDYFKKLAIDHYLKAMYPVIQLSYLSAMNERYKASGDYINMRWCALTTMNYVYEWMKRFTELVNMAASTPAGSTGGMIIAAGAVKTSIIDGRGQTVTANDVISKIFNNMKQYMDILNTNFLGDRKLANTTPSETMKHLLKGLRKLSNDVENQSLDVSNLQKEMYHSQLSIRNVNENLKQLNKLYYRRLFEYYLIMTVMIIVAIAAIILLILKKGEMVIFGSAALMILILMYKLVLMIISYFFSK